MTMHRRSSEIRKPFPYVRYSTIEPPFQFWHSGPRIKLAGEWLQEAGFFSNWRIKVTVYEGKLIIEPLIKPLCALKSSAFPLRPLRLKSVAFRSAQIDVMERSLD